MPLLVSVPIRTRSEGNYSEHWAVRSKRHKEQKNLVFWELHDKPKVELPCTVRMTRVGKRELDSDNLQFALKYIRDAVSEWLIPGTLAGRADNDPRITWEYAQASSNHYEVIIEIF